MQYKCRVHMQSKCTILKRTWTLIHTKGLVNIRMATCEKKITHMFSMVHAFTCVYAMCVNKHCSTHQILCYKCDPFLAKERQGQAH